MLMVAVPVVVISNFSIPVILVVERFEARIAAVKVSVPVPPASTSLEAHV